MVEIANGQYDMSRWPNYSFGIPVIFSGNLIKKIDSCEENKIIQFRKFYDILEHIIFFLPILKIELVLLTLTLTLSARIGETAFLTLNNNHSITEYTYTIVHKAVESMWCK
jgi:TRAP-type mannitol/chloroaromatic compound transport system permease small subunit